VTVRRHFVVSSILVGAVLAWSFTGQAQSTGKKRVWSDSGLRFAIDEYDFRIARQGKRIFSAQKLLDAELEDTRRSWSPDSPSAESIEIATFHSDLQPVSIVGTLVSLRSSGVSMVPGNPHDHPWETVTTRDFSAPNAQGDDWPGREVSLLDYWTERQLLRALLSDRYLGKFLPAEAKPSTLASLWQLVANARPAPEDDEDACNYDVSIDEWLLRSFAFLRISGDRVAVRIWLSGRSAICRATSKQLGLWLPIPKRLREPIARADRQQLGFLMKDVKRLAIPTYSVSAEGAELLPK
jgi:hypothetical protein